MSTIIKQIYTYKTFVKPMPGSWLAKKILKLTIMTWVKKMKRR